MRKPIFTAISIIILASMVLAGCATPTPQTVVQTQLVPQTQVVKETQVVTVKETQVVLQTQVVAPTKAPVAPGSTSRAMKPCTSMGNSGVRLSAGTHTLPTATMRWLSARRMPPG